MEFSPEIDIDNNEAERLLLAPPKPNEDHPDPFTDTMIHEVFSNIIFFFLNILCI